jgi:hypothetical protein
MAGYTEYGKLRGEAIYEPKQRLQANDSVDELCKDLFREHSMLLHQFREVIES